MLNTESVKRIIILSVIFLWCVFLANAERRPVIGISDLHKDGTNAAVPRSYVDAVLLGGGIPVVVPLMHDDEKIIELLNSLDGIIFTGGEDFDPVYYNERPIQQMGKINAPRDEFDLKLLRLAVERSIPVLGICRGIQLINIAFGGTLYQDLSAQYHDNSIRHRQRQAKDEVSHSVFVEDNTIFADIVKERMLMVNSSHHQAIKDVARGFRVAGRSPDKIVEVIEKVDDDNWILGVQFHPEVRVTRDNAMRRIFQRFVHEASRLESPNRNVKIASVPQPQIIREPVPEPQAVYKSVIDTQFIYKFIKDTVYVSVDTVYIYIPEYISVIDTQYISVTDTQYISVPDTRTVYVTDTVYIPTPDVTNPASVKPDSSSVSSGSVIKTVKAESDTLIYTPGASDVITDTSKKTVSGIPESKKKNEEKEKAKRERKEAELKEAQARKEQIERARQNKKLKDEKDKLAQEEAKAKEKQFQKEQKENAKLDKKELKEQKNRDKEALKEKQKQEAASKNEKSDITSKQEPEQKESSSKE